MTDFTENSISSLGTFASEFKASQTASTGPVPSATTVFSTSSSVSNRVTVAVGLDSFPQLT